MSKQWKVDEPVWASEMFLPTSRHQQELLVPALLPCPRGRVQLVNLPGPPTSARILLVLSMGGSLDHPLVGGRSGPRLFWPVAIAGKEMGSSIPSQPGHWGWQWVAGGVATSLVPGSIPGYLSWAEAEPPGAPWDCLGLLSLSPGRLLTRHWGQGCWQSDSGWLRWVLITYRLWCFGHNILKWKVLSIICHVYRMYSFQCSAVYAVKGYTDKRCVFRARGRNLFDPFTQLIKRGTG